ncbi:MAG: hypothetical protein Q8L10_05590 [Candidatus Moranbacteria bacterium]|nr:hypothetical protein [Candidatus Moranbacteria bacterium]
MRKPMQILIIIIFGLLFLFVIVFYQSTLQKTKQDYQLKVDNLNQEIVLLKKQILDNKQKEDITKSWKNYQDEELGINFKYPENFSLTKSNSYKRITLNPSEVGLEIPFIEIKIVSENIDSLLNNSASRLMNKSVKNPFSKDVIISGLQGKMIGNSGSKNTEISEYREVFVKISPNRILTIKSVSFNETILDAFLSSIQLK